MKKIIFCLLTVGMIVGTSNKMNGQNSAVAADVDAKATIIAPIAISAGTELNFGMIVKGTAVSTVKLTDVASTVRTVETGDASFPSSSGDTPTSSHFTVTGEENYGFSIALPASILLTNGTSAEDMTVNNFTSNGTVSDVSSVLPAGGSYDLYVGATLNLAADQPSGVFTGTYDVTVAYN